jgi:hypothetical protein
MRAVMWVLLTILFLFLVRLLLLRAQWDIEQRF